MISEKKKRESELTQVGLGVLILMLSLCALTFLIPEPVSSTPKEIEQLQARFFSLGCAQIHSINQHAHNQKVMFESVSDDEVKSYYWAELQLAIEERTAIIDSQRDMLVWQAGGGNIPSDRNVCVY